MCIRDRYRRGKHIIFRLDNGFLLIHLGMTGVIRYLKKGDDKKYGKHDHFDIELKDNSILRYNDVRKFGSLHWTDCIDEHFLIKNLGPEPLSKAFDHDYLRKSCKNRNIPIKNLIMDQNIVVGIGNIYASESLFLSKIRPNKRCKYLKDSDCKVLVESIKIILNRSIKAGGTTLKDFKSIDGKPGYFKQKLLIYDQLICKCGNKIKNIKLGGRSSYYCSNCQK